MKFTYLPLLILFFNINLFAQDSCSDLSEDECFVAPDCQINYNAAGQFEGCIEMEDDGPPECTLDCPGISDINSDNPDELCDWIISINGTECMEDCDEETTFVFEYLSDACYECLSDNITDCAEVFEDDEGNDDGAGEDDGPPECTLDCPGVFDINSDNPDEICDWIISINGTECMEDCDEETMLGFEYLSDACYSCLSDATIDCADIFDEGEDNEDDGGWEDFNCEDINNPEECLEVGCEWNGSPNMPGGFCSGEWNEEDEEDFECEEITNPEECYQVGCEWGTVTTPNGIFEMCVEPSGDDGGWNDEGCFENGEWYCYGCELFINECEYYECTDNGWVGPFENPDCDNNGDGGGDDDGPPECLLDCAGIEYVDPDQDPYEACDWIISNFGPNNFFNECANDCDAETMEIINQLSEVCWMCLSDEDIDCADVWEDGDDGDTGGGEEGCLDVAGQWYDYGHEMFINECEYYECTEEGWMGPFIIDNCWNNCYEITNEADCWANSDCIWVYDGPNNNSGYCANNDNPLEGEAILKLESTTGVPGTTISVPLLLINSESVGGIQFSIELDSPYNNNPGLIIEDFQIMDDCFSASYNEINNQMIGIVFSLEGCVYPASDYAHIGNIFMYINEDMPLGSELPLSFIYTLVSDPLGNEIPSYGEESSITIGVQGDVNYDGEVNVLDIVTIVSFAIYAEEPSESQFWASDINNDGMINILDIVQLINVVLGE